MWIQEDLDLSSWEPINLLKLNTWQCLTVQLTYEYRIWIQRTKSTQISDQNNAMYKKSDCIDKVIPLVMWNLSSNTGDP